MINSESTSSNPIIVNNAQALLRGISLLLTTEWLRAAVDELNNPWTLCCLLWLDDALMSSFEVKSKIFYFPYFTVAECVVNALN